MTAVPPRIGRCIYCNATQYAPNEPSRPLGEEHIIPRGLGGTRVLNASCQLHEKTTTQVETKCIDHIVSHARHDLGIYGRRANRKARRAAAKQLATFVALYGFGPPGLFAGSPGSDDIAGKIYIHGTTPELQPAPIQQGPHNLNFRHGGFHAIDFARLLAKIGHAYAMRTVRTGCDFAPPPLNLINGIAPMNDLPTYRR